MYMRPTSRPGFRAPKASPAAVHFFVTLWRSRAIEYIVCSVSYYPLQRKWLLPLCLELGMGAYGATADGGIGGDIEVFAVKGRHTTPWHWDGQVS